MRILIHHNLILLLLLSASIGWAQGESDVIQDLSRDDRPLRYPVIHPDWFKLSFLDLQEDLDDALADGKEGIIVYFGQRDCPYCQALMEVNFGKEDIERYTRKHFDVIAIDIHGRRPVIDMQGRRIAENRYASREQTQFTPSLIFYDKEGEEALRLRGYYPPYKFRAALEFVADGHYRGESFRQYLERADSTLRFEPDGLNDAPFAMAPPYALQRIPIPAQRPLLVLFERGECHACDVLHSEPLLQPEIRRLLDGFDVVQLDMNAETIVLTPDGTRTTARKWAVDMELFYAPTLIFFDRDGSEIIRVASVVGFNRLRGVLEYVLSDAYKRGMTLQQWRRERNWRWR